MVTSTLDNPSLIVSANDVIMHTVCQEETPIHRNKALEHAGSKPPRSYIDSETSAKIEHQSKEEVSKLSSMESELAELRMELQKARSESEQLRNLKQRLIQIELSRNHATKSVTRALKSEMLVYSCQLEESVRESAFILPSTAAALTAIYLQTVLMALLILSWVGLCIKKNSLRELQTLLQTHLACM